MPDFHYKVIGKLQVYSHVFTDFCLIFLVNLILFIIYGYGSIPVNTIFRGMTIHLPAILMFTRGTRF